MTFENCPVTVSFLGKGAQQGLFKIIVDMR